MPRGNTLVRILGGILAAVVLCAGPARSAYDPGGVAKAQGLISQIASDSGATRRSASSKLSDLIAQNAQLLAENPQSAPFLDAAGQGLLRLVIDGEATVRVRAERLLEQLVAAVAEVRVRGNPTAQARALDLIDGLAPRLEAGRGNESVAALADRAAKLLKAAGKKVRTLEEVVSAPVAEPSAPAAKPAAPPTPTTTTVVAPPKPAAPPAPTTTTVVAPPKPAAPPAPTTTVTVTKSAPPPAPSPTSASSRPKANPVVLRMLEDKLRRPGEREQSAALELAVSLKDQILAGVEDDDTYTRRMSTNILGLVRGMLQSPSAAVRQIAARTAGALQDVQAVGELIELLGDSDGAIRSTAFEALRSVTGKDFGMDVQKWRAWSGSNG